MKILTKELETKLTNAKRECQTNKPYLKLFSPVGSAIWLISEYMPDERMFFGLCDLGMGSPELGYVGLDEILETTLQWGLKIERDTSWTPDHTLNTYYEMARKHGRIVYA